MSEAKEGLGWDYLLSGSANTESPESFGNALKMDLDAIKNGDESPERTESLEKITNLLRGKVLLWVNDRQLDKVDAIQEFLFKLVRTNPGLTLEQDLPPIVRTSVSLDILFLDLSEFHDAPTKERVAQLLSGASSESVKKILDILRNANDWLPMEKLKEKFNADSPENSSENLARILHRMRTLTLVTRAPITDEAGDLVTHFKLSAYADDLLKSARK